MSNDDFGGRAVVSFESRRATEMASLIARHGGVPTSAPSMREAALGENTAALAFAQRLSQHEFDIIVFMTGVGTRALLDDIAPALSKETFAEALSAAPTVIARGPKPAAVLREIGVSRFITAPEPNTSKELLSILIKLNNLNGARVAIQEYGAPTLELYEALSSRGAQVFPVPVYRWALPLDTQPLRTALHAIAGGDIHIALFTSRAQVEHVFLVAAEEGIAERVRDALRRGFVASIGPVCTEALRAEGITPRLEPQHPKMGHLVKEAAHAVAQLGGPFDQFDQNK